MRYQKLDLNLLTALRALLAEKSVTRAGEVVHVTQSAMSGVLSRLREYFGDPLIVQVGRKMELTPLAESLVEPVNDVLLRIDATIATRPEFNPLITRRHFSISTFPRSGKRFFPSTEAATTPSASRLISTPAFAPSSGAFPTLPQDARAS